MEVLWKAVARLLNRRITADILYHDVLHGFRAGRRKGTADLEAKLPQHLTAMREAALFKIFLDLRKAYNALDRERALELLAAYGVGLRMVRLIHTYWDRLTMEARASRYSGRPFKECQGVTQGNSVSPKHFNVVLDAAILHRPNSNKGRGASGV